MPERKRVSIRSSPIPVHPNEDHESLEARWPKFCIDLLGHFGFGCVCERHIVDETFYRAAMPLLIVVIPAAVGFAKTWLQASRLPRPHA